MIYSLAENLGKFAYEVEALSPHEFATWLAHFTMKQEAQESSTRNAEAKAKRDGNKLPSGTPHQQRQFPVRPKKVAVKRPK